MTNEAPSLIKDALTVLRRVYLYRKLFAVIFLSGIILTLAIHVMLPKQYRAQASFFVPIEDMNNAPSFSSLTGLGLMGAGNSFSNRLLAVLNSQLIKDSVVGILAPTYQEGTPLNLEDAKAEASSDLKLYKYFSVFLDQYGIFKLSYIHQDPDIAFQVVQAYLDRLQYLNNELSISAQKKLFVVLDAPTTPQSRYKPKLKVNLAIGMILSFIIAFFVVQFIDLITLVLKVENTRQ